MSYPEKLRALSIAGSFAWQIAIEIKPIEYRTWPIRSLRGLVLLHASQTNWDDTWDEFIQAGEITREQAQKAKGCIVGAGFLVGLETYGTQDYGHVFDGCFCFDPEDWQPAPGARNYWRPKKPAQQQAFSRAWELIQAGQYQAANPARTTELLVEHGHRKPRIWICGPGGHITTNTGS